MNADSGIDAGIALSSLGSVFNFLDEDELCVLPKDMIKDTAQWPDRLQDLRGQIHHFTPVILSPNSTEKIQKIVQICQKYRLSIIPQGGNTGRVGGALPSQRQHQDALAMQKDGVDGNGSGFCRSVLLCLSRLDTVIDYRKNAGVITVGAGMVLDNLNHFLEKEGHFMFPVQMGSSSRAQIGGVLSTNAGGMNAVRYGMARHYCLGIEAVLPNGEIINTLSPVYKNNIGPNIAQLLCGSEGIMGIITKACLKLVPRPNDDDFMTMAAIIPGNKMTDMACFHHHIQKKYGIITDRLEIISIKALAAAIKTGMMSDMPSFITEAVDHDREGCDEDGHDWLLIWRSEVPQFIQNHQHVMDDLLANIHDGLLDILGDEASIFVANTITESQKIWKMRDDLVWAQKPIGYNIKHDIAVPIDKIGDFYCDVEKSLDQSHPSALVFCFGHLGDGNLHFNVILPKQGGNNGKDIKAIYADDAKDITQIVDDFVQKYQGSISAEHGIGQANTRRLRSTISKAHYAMLQDLKSTIDPHHIMNPGKVVE